MNALNIGIVSLGCAKNLVDTEAMLGILGHKGFRIVADPQEADVIIVNTCAFIDTAKEESVQTILEMAAYKEKRCRLLIVSGCMAERYHDEILAELPCASTASGTGRARRKTAAGKAPLMRVSTTIRYTTPCGQTCCGCAFLSSARRTRS